MKTTLLAALAVIGIAAPASASDALQLKYLNQGSELTQSAINLIKATGSPTRACAQLSAAVDAYALAYAANPDKAGLDVVQGSVDLFANTCPQFAAREVQ